MSRGRQLIGKHIAELVRKLPPGHQFKSEELTDDLSNSLGYQVTSLMVGHNLRKLCQTGIVKMNKTRHEAAVWVVR